MGSISQYLYRKSSRRAIQGSAIAPLAPVSEGRSFSCAGQLANFSHPERALAREGSAPRSLSSACVLLLAAASVFAAPAWAQGRRQQQQQQTQQQQTASSPSATSKKSKRGPRAIAVLEFLPGGGMRLVPVALWIDGKYYDASLYGANPQPMAVEPETIYEAQSLGEPTGTFTISQPRQVNGNWVADGTWLPQLAMDQDVARRTAKDAASKPKSNPSQAIMTGGSDDSRPVLKRAPGSGGDSGSSTQPSQSTTQSDPDRPVMKRPADDSASSGQSSSSTTANADDRPVMKRPPSDSSSKPSLGSTDDSSTAGTTTAQSQSRTVDSDPNRPVMKRTSPSSSSPSGTSDSSGPMPMTQAAAASNDADPNRPTLSHSTTPKPQLTSDVSSARTDVPFSTNAKVAKAYPAISDASEYRGRPLLYAMSPGERQTQEQQALKVALDEIRTFAAKHNGPPIPKTASITDFDVRAYDLDYSSSPTIVLSAKLAVTAAAKGQTLPANFSYFVTLVARVDINDHPVKIFSQVTDSRHLDAYPRMELIDAIDADANGRADLLFRQYSDTGITYGLYRVAPYNIEKVFEGGSSL